MKKLILIGIMVLVLGIFLSSCEQSPSVDSEIDAELEKELSIEDDLEEANNDLAEIDAELDNLYALLDE